MNTKRGGHIAENAVAPKFVSITWCDQTARFAVKIVYVRMADGHQNAWIVVVVAYVYIVKCDHNVKNVVGLKFVNMVKKERGANSA